MNDDDKISKQALDAAKGGNVDEANELLEPYSKANCPRFFWLAKAEIARVENDKKKQAGFLWAFKASLTGRRLTALGFDRPGTHSAEDLTKNAPEKLTTASLAADAAYAQGKGDPNEAIPLLQKAIEISIADLKSLGDDIFE